MALEQWYGMSRQGLAESEGEISKTIDSAWSGGASGDGFGVTFVPMVAVSGGDVSIWIYVQSVDGTSPTCTGEIFDIHATVWETNQAGGTPITNGTSAAKTITTDTAGWYEIAWTNVTLTANKPYQVWFYNSTSGTEATDYFTVYYEGGAEMGNNTQRTFLTQQITTGGGNNFAVNRANPPVVIQLNTDATATTYGFPGCVNGAPDANTDYRGLRFKVSEEKTVWGVRIFGLNDADSDQVELHSGASGVLATATIEHYDWNLNCPMLVFDAPYTLLSETAYDILLNPSAATNDMERVSNYGSGENEPATPAAVKLAWPRSAAGYQWRWVDGATVDTGLSENTSIIPLIEVYFSDNPTQAGGGGGMKRHAGMGGGVHG